MAWALGAVGTFASGVNCDSTPLNVPYPSGISAGHILFLAVSSNGGAVDFTLSDFSSEIVSRVTNGTLRLFWKIATGSESGNVTVQTPSGITSSVCAQIARFTGGPSSLASAVHAADATGGSAATGLGWPAIDITADGTLVLVVGAKSCGANTFSVPAAMDAELGEGVQGSSACFVWDYDIQTTAAALSAGSWTIGAGDAAAARRSVVAALLAGSSLTRKLKVLAHSDAQSKTGVAGVVFQAPGGSDITGAKIGEFTGAAFSGTLEGGQSVLKVPVADFGGGALGTSDTPRVHFRYDDSGTLKGCGIAAATVIDE